jgi:hypothetical protein
MLSISQIRASGGHFDLIERDGEFCGLSPPLDHKAALGAPTARTAM